MSRTPWVIAHRGAPTLATENTLSSFEEALRLGVEAIELDIHLTKDARLIVHHDEKLGRTVEGKEKISDCTLAELKQRKIVAAADSERIPTLEEVFDLCRGKCHLIVEAKSKTSASPLFAQAIVNVFQARSTPKETTLISFCHPLLAEVRELDPKITIGPSFEKKHRAKTGLKLHPAAVVMNHRIVDSAQLKDYQTEKISTWIYTVDEPKEWKRLTALGVSGIITNRPDLFSV